MKKFLTYFGALGTHRVHNKTAHPQRGTADFGLKRTDGFGLIEVLCAAVVLGFMLVGLAVLQKGNREGIIRVRARDSANFVAHHILDSLSGVGLNSLVPASGERCPPAIGELVNAVYKNCEYIYTFEGHPQRDKSGKGITSEIKYSVEVSILPSDELLHPTEKQVIDSTLFTKANRSSGSSSPSASEKNTYSKSLNATVSWEFKKSTQSIHIAKVVR
ncbi:hypothetical protein AGMMS49938_17850 [Fibrobacterales bacterium]|nr:hypothetical protein AGMMS49938_17850 [Fibrobacterales bacterium]